MGGMIGIESNSPPKRKSTKVYHDFLYSKLTTEEKMIYIALKTFVEFGEDNDTVWPSYETLEKITSMSEYKIRKSIKTLVAKGYIKKKQRGLNQTNIYVIKDTAEIWQSDNPKSVFDEDTQLNVLVGQIKQLGYDITLTKKGLPLDTDQSTNGSQYMQGLNHTSYVAESQPHDIDRAERYSVQDIVSLFDFHIIRADVGNNDADAVLNVLYDTLNTRREYIRVGQQDRPTMVVIGRLMKLDYTDIEFAIRQYNSLTSKVKNPTAYIVTLLYNAKEQNRLSMLNEGHVNGDF